MAEELTAMPLLTMLFAGGLAVGFGHCLGMCGPIAVSLSLGLQEKSILLPHVLYTAGRISTYAILGGLMGASGSFVRVAAGMAGLQKVAAIVAGIVVILMGLSMTGRFALFSGRFDLPGSLSSAFRKASHRQTPLSYLFLGLLLGLLPCGPVYTALIAAAGAGMETQGAVTGFVRGMAAMAAFGAGTAPALLLAGRLAGFSRFRSQKAVLYAGSILMTATGTYFVIQGIRM